MLSGTFGKTKAAKNLEQILNEIKDKKTIAVVSKLYHRATKILNGLDMLRIDPPLYEFVFTLYFDYYKMHMKISKPFVVLPTNVQTHLKTVIYAEFHKRKNRSPEQHSKFVGISAIARYLEPKDVCRLAGWIDIT